MGAKGLFLNGFQEVKVLLEASGRSLPAEMLEELSGKDFDVDYAGFVRLYHRTERPAAYMVADLEVSRAIWVYLAIYDMLYLKPIYNTQILHLYS